MPCAAVFGRIFTSAVKAVALSARICVLTLRLYQAIVQRSIARLAARHSHNVRPSAVPIETPWRDSSAAVIGMATWYVGHPPMADQTPVPHGEASVPISTSTPSLV